MDLHTVIVVYYVIVCVRTEEYVYAGLVQWIN